MSGLSSGAERRASPSSLQPHVILHPPSSQALAGSTPRRHPPPPGHLALVCPQGWRQLGWGVGVH